MAEELYVYAVTRVHMHEQGLLNQQDLENLIAARDVREAFRLLGDKGWGSAELPAQDADALIAFELDRTWSLVAELLDDLSPFNVFLLANDFHNLKAAIKLAYTAQQENTEGYFMKYATVPLENIIKAANEHDFSMLPQDLAQAGRDAYEVLAHTGNGQNSDMVIDSAALVAIDKAGKITQSNLLRQYAQLTVDSANIKAAVRCARMNKSEEFIQRAIAPAGTLDTKWLVKAAGQGLESVYAFLQNGKYSGAVDELKVSMSSFERWCDNQMVELIRPQKNNYFTIEPLAAYILGRENEIKMVRLILSAKINQLDAGALRERLRETYV